MTRDEYRRALEWTLQILGARFADACERRDWSEAEQCVQTLVARQADFERRTVA